VDAATCAFNLGHAFKDLPVLRDLDRAEGSYRRSLVLREESDSMGRARCIGQLGHVAYERFRDALNTERPEEELLQYLNEAVTRYQEALDLLPADAVNDLAVGHHQLGSIFGDAGDLDRAVHHYRESIHYEEAQGNLYGAAQTRGNVAIALFNAGRRADALEYAEAALRGFEPYGAGAVREIEMTRGLIATIRGA
ncbi:MAG TPA: tetratricopeptide repeat protein, partial [Thermoanaerobaculia bacterium]|nr:tetratricopeptide repeat protein [Thermoanaerobaculia bacterium]